ncbi:MAG: hypothetical protein Q4B65_00290 [Candidatus Saccharibacteria bacterium]|nr:hypothetical protein [Candidatus Saccharibacteria bacterium]
MQTSNKKQGNVVMRRKVQNSTVVNRSKVQKSTKITKATPAMAEATAVMAAMTAASTTTETGMPASEMPSTDLSRVTERMRARTNLETLEATRPTAKEIKEQAIKKALASAERTVKSDKKTKKMPKLQVNWGRFVLALSCAATVVFAIVYFVNLSSPNLSFQVAAMQTGIDASYPSYVPRDYSLSDITSESGKIEMNFINRSEGKSFSLTEEASSWDSNALLENFVRKEYGKDFSMVRENGLTIYISGSKACWVNGGVVYKIAAENGVLTKKQISAIATSL